jgi:hypothetical protein
MSDSISYSKVIVHRHTSNAYRIQGGTGGKSLQVFYFAVLLLVFFYHHSLFTNQNDYLMNGVLEDHLIQVMIVQRSKFSRSSEVDSRLEEYLYV